MGSNLEWVADAVQQRPRPIHDRGQAQAGQVAAQRGTNRQPSKARPGSWGSDAADVSREIIHGYHGAGAWPRIQNRKG